MTLVESPTVVPDLVDAVRKKLQDAPAPLKLAEVTKGLPKPKKVKAADFQEDVRRLINEEVRLGQAFRYPSGPKGVERYWAKDEKQALRTAAIQAAGEPLTLAKLRDAAKRTVRGADNKYVEAVIVELVTEGQLFKHQITARTQKYAGHPQPILEEPRFRDIVKSLTGSARKLQDAAGLTTDQLIEFLRNQLGPEKPSTSKSEPAELDNLILKAVAAEGGTDGTVSIPSLRRQMPPEYRSPAFDAAVFRLADQEKVFLIPDNRALQLGEAELAELVKDGNETYFAQIGLRE